MKRRFMQFASLALSLALLLCAAPARAAAGIPATIRVGLAYGSAAVPGANLLNSAGSGYRLGYFDASLNFVQLGYTSETGISVVKTQNVWYGPLPGNLNGYSDTQTSGAAVGGYHLQLPVSYASFEEAQAAAVQAGGFAAWIGGVYYVRVGAYLSAEEANTALAVSGIAGAAVAGTSAGGMSVVKTGSSTILFQYDSGGTDGMLAVKPGLDDSVKTTTWYAGSKYFGAFRYQRMDGGNLTVVNVLEREDYINCVISQEMDNSTHIEALKAQAVAARSYAAMCATRHTGNGFDLCATTHCQAYPGVGRIGDNTTRAAAETAGQFAWYNGSIAQTYYFSSDGGATEDSKNVWTSALPYLVGVLDPWEAQVESKIKDYRWTVTFDAERLEAVRQRMRSSGRDCGAIASVAVSELTAMGNVKAIKVTDTAGKSWTVTGADKCRVMLGLKSIRYSISGGSGGGYSVNEGGTLSSVTGAYAIDGSGNISQISGDAPYVITDSGTRQLAPSTDTGGGTFTATGTGWGHGVGMSQWGAIAMAQAGKSYTEILKYYYTGIEVR